MLGRGTRARRRLAAGMLLCAAVGATTAAPASAEVRSGSATDPASDQTGSVGANDLLGAKVDYDSDAGVATTTFTFRDAPSSASTALAAVALGMRVSGECRLVLVLYGRIDPAASPGVATWAIVGGASGAATRTHDLAAKTMTVRAQDSRLTGGTLDCARAETSLGDDTFDEIGEFPLAVPPAPEPLPEPGIQPQPQPQTPQPAPQPQLLKPTPQSQPAPAPKKLAPPKGVQLAVEAPALEPLKRNAWRKAKLSVANTGAKAATRVKLRLTVPKGVSAKRTSLSLGTIRSGKRKTVTVKVRLTAKAKATSTVTARVSSATKGAKTARGKIVLQLWRKATKKPAPGPATPGQQLPSLVGQAFTRVHVDVMSSNRWYAYSFLDDKWAYRGVPESGFPQCTAKTAGVDEHGEPTDGCVPYTYDGRTNVLTIDGQQLAVSPDRTSLTQGEDTYTLSPIPAAGSTWNLALRGVDVWGFWPNQTVTQRWLTTTTAGQFSMTGSTMGTFGGGAMTPGGGNFSVVPPDQKGTYAVLPGGTLELRFESGEVQRKSIMITRDAKTGDADPARVGLLLDGVQYFLETDD